MQTKHWQIFLQNKKKALLDLNTYIHAISGKNIDTVWTTEAIYTSNEWKEIRRLAKLAIEAMGWSISAPTKNNATYVSEDLVVHNKDE